MDPILQMLLNWQMVLFGLAIAAVTFVIRKVIEYAMANWQFAAKESKMWTDLILPILPVFLGVGGALLFKMFPYPNGLTGGESRGIFGLVAGLLSTLLYRVVNTLLGQKIDVPPTAPGTPPTPTDTTKPSTSMGSGPS